jgi:hypothetical protein
MLTLSWFRHKPAVQSTEAPLVRFTIEHEVQYTRFTVHLGFTSVEAADIAGQDMFGHHAVTGWQGGDSWEAWCEPARPGGEVALHVDIVVRDEEWEQALWRAQDVATELAGYLSRQPATFEHRRPIGTGWLTRTDDWSENEWLITVPIHGVNRA